MQLQLSDELCELSILAAAVARINNENYTDLLQNLLDQMNAQEKAYYRDLYTDLTFSRSGRVSKL